jgi:hypothetical protein
MDDRVWPELLSFSDAKGAIAPRLSHGGRFDLRKPEATIRLDLVFDWVGVSSRVAHWRLLAEWSHCGEAYGNGLVS